MPLIVFINVTLLYRTGSRKRKLSQDETLEDQITCFNQQFHPIPPNFVPCSSSSSSSSSIVYQQQQQQQRSVPWLDYPYNSQSKRKSCVTSLLSNGSDNRPLSHHHFIDRKPSVPYSPPHQSYDHYRPSSISNNPDHYYYHYYEKTHHPHQHYQHNRANMIPSPPPQSSLFKPPSLNDTLPLRRQSTGPSLYYRPSDTSAHHYHLSGSRRLSLQQYSPKMIHPPTPASISQQCHRSPLNRKELIHLPPLRSIVHNNSLTQQSLSRQAQDGIVEVDAAVAMMQLASMRQKQQQTTTAN